MPASSAARRDITDANRCGPAWISPPQQSVPRNGGAQADEPVHRHRGARWGTGRTDGRHRQLLRQPAQLHAVDRQGPSPAAGCTRPASTQRRTVCWLTPSTAAA
jgi:hypothetical protein